MSAWVLVALGGVAGVLALLVGLVVYIALRRAGGGPSTRGYEARWPAQVHRDMETLTRDLHRLAHDIEQRVDARIETLRALLDRADSVMARLEGPDRSEAQGRYEGGEQDPTQGPDETDFGVQNPAVTDEDADSGDPYEQAARLARQGLGPDQIAHQTGLPAGEVALVLNLQRCRGQASR